MCVAENFENFHDSMAKQQFRSPNTEEKILPTKFSKLTVNSQTMNLVKVFTLFRVLYIYPMCFQIHCEIYFQNIEAILV